jgi:PAS domain S-box-containing protein
MLILINFIIYFSAKLTRPITLLESAISDFDINEAPIKLEKRGNNDEIAYLYDAYNKMTKSLYQSNLIETKLEKENKFLEENLSQFIESANALIFGIDSKGIINEWNLVSEKITGYKKEEVLGKDVVTVFVPQDKSWYVRKTMSNVLNGKESTDFEFPMVSKEGKEVLLLLNLIAFRDLNHEVIGVIGIGQDITDRKNREDQFRLVVDSAPNAIVLVNFSGNIALVNKQTEKQFGYTSEELIGKEMEILIPSHYKKMHPNSRTKFHDDPKSRVMGVGRELYVLRKDGTEFPVEIGLSPIETPEETLVMVSIIDITVRKEYEKTLRNKERRAEELLHAKEKIAIQKKTLKKEKELRLLKSKFVSIASHEFRTPLSAINFAAGSIKRYWDKMEPNMIEKKLSKIEDQVLHMTNLLDDMITVGQAEAGKIRNKPLIVNLGDFIIDIIDEVYRSYQKSHKIMLIDNEELKNSDIFIDRKVGRNIFINLLSNAIKYSPGAEKVTVELSSEKNRIIISVRDYGMGIPESEIENIFKPFIRGNKVDLIQGTGLGLSIVKDALDVLKGEILVESNLGEGSTFIVKIPKKNK